MSATVKAAAEYLGVAPNTMRNWDRDGKIRTRRDAANRRLVPLAEVERLASHDTHTLSARNRFRGVVASVEIEGLLAQVEIDVTEPVRLVAVITRDAAESLGLAVGDSATGVVKATSVMVER